MASPAGILHCLCGKPAAGKSTLCAELGREPGAITLSEDDWLARLYGDEMSTLGDFVRNSGRLRTAIAPHIVALLREGMTVVLDFHANTIDARRWMRSLAEEAGAECRLHYLDVPDALCLTRLAERRARGDHPFTVTDEQFHRVVAHLVVPTEDEGLEIIRHRCT
jgi:predicted kinase